MHRMFSTSILLSAARCLLAYVVFPVVTLGLGIAAAVGPIVGIPIGVVALGFDIVGMRRFWVADHRWRWGFTALYLAVIALILVLLALDAAALA